MFYYYHRAVDETEDYDLLEHQILDEEERYFDDEEESNITDEPLQQVQDFKNLRISPTWQFVNSKF